MEVTLDKFGRILLPKALRKALGIRPGAKLSLKVEDSKLTLTPSDPDGMLKRINGVLVWTGPVGDIDFQDVLERTRDERISRIAGIPWS